MAHWSLFPGNHEIVEIEEDLNRGEQYRTNNYMKPELKREEKDRSLVANSRHISSLEDDLNQLFEVFSRRASSSGLVHPTQASSSKKSASKRPVIPGGSYSPKNGISERGNLKQALRGLCLSQASEMAAMKRSAKTSGSSKAGKIMTLYRNVVVEDGSSEHSLDDGKGGMLEISLVPEEKGFDSFQNSPENMTGSDSWPSNRSSLVERETKFTQVENGSFFESKISSNPEKPVSVMSLSSPHDNNRADVDHSPLNQRRMIVTSAEVGNRASLAEMRQEQKHTLLPSSSSSTAKNSTQEMALSSMKFSPATEFVSQASLTDSLPKENHESSSSSSSSHCKTSLEPARKMPAQKEMQHKEKAHSPCRSDPGDRNWEHGKSAMSDTRKLSASAEFASQTFSTDSITKDKHTPLLSSPPSNGKTSLELASRVLEKKEKSSLSVGARNQTKDEMLLKDEPAPSECNKSSPVGNRSPRKEPVGKSDKVEYESSIKAVKKDSSKILPSTGSPKVKKGSKSTRHTSHFVKPLVKTKNFVKRKSKKSMAVDNSSRNKQCEFNNDLYTSPSSLVCPRCQCVVTGAWQEASQESPVSLQESLLSGQESPIYHHESPVSYQESPVSPFGSLSAEVSSGNVISDVSTPGPSSESLNKTLTVVAEARGNSKTRDKGEFSQSSKGSPDECSTGTSISEESNLSRPSFCDRPHKSKDVRWEAIRHIRYQHGAIGLRHFNLLKKLGCGDIGTVYLAELIGTNCQFAIKVMDNEFLVRRKKISRAQTEREILRMLDHPFLPTLYCQFTSDNLSCLVMEYCPGGDLHVLRQRQPGRCFTEQAARFYAAEVLLALEYLHMLGVVYRDLKPENILVREDGHIMLSDFDLSLRCAVSPTLLVSSSMSERSKKVSRPCVDSRCAQPLCIEPSCQVTCFTPRLLASSSRLRKQKSDLAAEMRPLLQLVAEPTTARSNSFVGTHEYLAPEIIKGEGHGSAVDWWTLGIFLYELLYGRTPFKGSGNDETLANVVLQTLKFPDSPLVSLQARDLIATLLVKEPENRLGTERGAAEIKQHPFFDGLNWALIRCAVPPELPEQWSYGIPKVGSLDKNKYVDYNSGSGEHLEFEVF